MFWPPFSIFSPHCLLWHALPYSVRCFPSLTTDSSLVFYLKQCQSAVGVFSAEQCFCSVSSLQHNRLQCRTAGSQLTRQHPSCTPCGRAQVKRPKSLLCAVPWNCDRTLRRNELFCSRRLTLGVTLFCYTVCSAPPTEGITEVCFNDCCVVLFENSRLWRFTPNPTSLMFSPTSILDFARIASRTCAVNIT